MPKARPDHQFSSKSISIRLKQHIDNPVRSGERVLVLRSWQDTHTRMNVYSVRDITPCLVCGFEGLAGLLQRFL
jgi:hypothetical protein